MMRRNGPLITISPGVSASLDNRQERRLIRSWTRALGPVLVVLALVGIALLNVYWLGR